MLDTAEYLEQRGELDKAVLLYQKAGRQRRAVELCFRAQLFDTLQAMPCCSAVVSHGLAAHGCLNKTTTSLYEQLMMPCCSAAVSSTII